MTTTTQTAASITTDAALAMAKAAHGHAHALDIKVSVAVTDAGGHLLAFLRDNGASFHSVGIAIDKAYSAAGFKAPTGGLGDALHGMGPMVFHGLLERPRMAAFSGGLPINIDGKTVGGIGVSGGTADEDEDCARAGVESIK